MRKDIILVSNASMNLYPGNKVGDFKVQLPTPQHFDSSYRVAVTRVSFTKSYFNYDFKPGERMIRAVHADSKNNYNPTPEHLNKCILSVAPLPGYYTPETFVEMLNLTIQDLLIKGDHEIKTYPEYSISNGYLMVVPGILKDKDGYETRWECGFDDYTTKVLGIEKLPIRPVFMMQGFTDLYLYSDLVFPTIVGDKTCELMCILDGQTDKPYGTHCTETYDQPWYLPLARNNFQTIHVYLRNDAGQELPFKFGRLNLRLSFRKEDEL